MRFSPKSLLLCSVLFSVGCASAPSWMARSKTQSDQQSEKAKLIAAAEQYERDGKTEMAEQLYARVAAQDAKKKATLPESEQIAASPKPKIESTAEPAREITAAELLADFEKNRAAQPSTVRTASTKTSVAASSAESDDNPFRNVSADSVAKTESKVSSKSTKNDSVPEWAAGLSTTDTPNAPETESELNVAEVDQTEPKNDSELPLWTLEKVSPDNVNATTEDEELAQLQPVEASDIDAGNESVTKRQSIDEWWDNVFVSENSETKSPPEIAEADNPFANSDVVEEQVVNAEPETAKTSVPEAAEAAVPTETVPEFEKAIGGWHRTSVARLCPELKPELEPVVSRLDSISEDDKIAALIELAELGEEAESAKLAVRALHQDDHELVQIYAAAATRSIESDAWDSIKILKSCLVSEDPEVVQLAAYTLGKIGPEAMDAADALGELRDGELSVTSLYAAEALTRITPHDGRSFDQFKKALQSDDAELRWFAAVTLGNATKPNQEQAVIALAEALQDEHPNVRTAAALSLGGFGRGAQPVLDELKRAAEFDTPEVREAARTALACLK